MAHTFNDHWITETLRLRESLWGPLEDSAEIGKARAQGGDFTDRVLTRARLLARREGLNATLTRWRQSAGLIMALFLVAAVLAGIAAAVGALGDGSRPVNLALALTALLGLNTITLLFWVLSFAIQAGTTGSALTELWLKLTRRLARGPDSALLPRALLEVMTRQKTTRWSAGIVSHGLWVAALLSALATLLILLATRRYTFQWETTLLSPDTFVGLVHGLGWLPSFIGFPQPSAEVVRASNGLQTLPDSAQALWSAWLLGTVVLYGLVPRIVALGLSIGIVRRRLGRLSLDPALPGIAELHDRLMPMGVSTGIDAPAPTLPRHGALVPNRHAAGGRRSVLGLELPTDIPWPPCPLPTAVTDLGVIDTREQRRALLEALRSSPVDRLLVCCDARQTPDRGTLALLTELSSLAGAMQVALFAQGDTPARRSQWQRQLLKAGFAPDQLAHNVTPGVAWLSDTMEHPT